MTDLAALLEEMGARIEGAGSDIIEVRGVERLHGADHAIPPDRIGDAIIARLGSV